MSADSAVTYTSVHSEARSWSIPSEDPYEEAARQLLEQAPRSPEYVPDPMELEDHVPVYIPKPEHPEDLVPAEDEAPIEAYITEVASAPPPPPSFLPSLIRPPRTRAAMAQMRAAAPSTYHLLLPLGTPPLLPIPLPTPSLAAELIFPRLTRYLGRGYYLLLLDLGVRLGRVLLLLLRDSQDLLWPKDRAAVRAEIKVLRRERLAYEQESMETCQALSRSEAYSRALEAQVTVLETQARRNEWQRQDADDRAMRHIMRIQALEAGACDDTLEDTGCSLLSITENGTKMNHKATLVTPTPTATTTTVTEAQLQALIEREVAAAMTEAEASRAPRESSDSLDGLRNAMPWVTRKKMMIDKYCPRGEIKKIETEMWNLKVEGTDVVAYNRRFQQLALMCSRMFPEEVDKIEKYIGGLPDMILGSVKASKSKTMQEVIEFTTELMEDKTHSYAERQAERKRKYDDLP
ncbi:reverse transcriptase domain-containing protein [Tanacetum coccineum]